MCKLCFPDEKKSWSGKSFSKFRGNITPGNIFQFLVETNVMRLFVQFLFLSWNQTQLRVIQSKLKSKLETTIRFRSILLESGKFPSVRDQFFKCLP